MDRQITQTIRIAAPAERVWAATADVACWPDWSSTVTSVHQLDGNGLQVGARFRIRQPLQQPAIWEVTELVAGKRFSWRSERRRMTWIACHELQERSRQDTLLRLRLTITDRRGGILWLFLRPLLSAALRRECMDIKAWCEGSR